MYIPTYKREVFAQKITKISIHHLCVVEILVREEEGVELLPGRNLRFLVLTMRTHKL